MTLQTSHLQQVNATLDEMRKIASSGQLYGVLDACDAPTVVVKAKELGEKRAVSLYHGSAEEEYWAIAPYLVRVDNAILDWIVPTLCKEPWGIFVVAEADLETLRKHFRRFLLAQLPNEEIWYFRYYDPRILEVYLSSCLFEELVEFFGPATALGTWLPALNSTLLTKMSTVGISTSRQRGSTTSTALPKIRPEQYEFFRRTATKNFEERMTQHLKEFFPGIYQSLGEEHAREVILYGMKRAASYQITIERDVCKYIDVMLIYGNDFDRDPVCEWATNILNDQQLKDSGDMVAQLFDVALNRSEGGELQAPNEP